MTTRAGQTGTAPGSPLLRAVVRGVDRLLPVAMRARDGDTLRRARLVVGASIIILVCALLTTGLVALQGPAENLPVSIAVTVLIAAVPTILRCTGSPRVGGHLIAGIVFAGLALAAVRGGGLLGLPYILLPAVPMLASFIVGLRAGLAWAGLSLAGVVALVAAMQLGLEPLMPVDLEAIERSHVRGVVVMLVLVVLSVWASDTARERALAKAHAAQAEAERRGLELERAKRELAEFTYVAAHDLKEPLRGLHSSAGLLMADCHEGLGQEGLRRAETIQRLAERMALYIDALRRMSEITREDLSREDVAVRRVVEEALETIGSQVAESGAVVRIEGDLPAVSGDPELLRTLFQNLLDNAIRLDARPDPQVRVGATRPAATDGLPGAPVFFVRSDGVALPKAREKDFFRIFKRSRAGMEGAGGATAGMAIARKIVEVHGGEIWLDTSAENGTAVRFWLGDGTA